MTESSPSSLRCGFVAVIGAPNAGKSTLVNLLTGTKVSIVSPKVQTTRTRVLGIMARDGSQVVLIDTPGLFAPRRRLERAMVASASDSARDADLVALVVDSTRPDPVAAHGDILESLRSHPAAPILVLNKIDAIDRARLLALAAGFNAALEFSHTFMVSARTGDGAGTLADHLAAAVPQGPWMYPEDQASDMPGKLLAAEITREKLFERLHEEIPHALAVETESWEERADGSIRIGQVIHLRRENHKSIVLGKGGAQIKAVGESARRDLSDILERKVHLFLHVRVSERWDEEADFYRLWGLDPKA